MKSFIQWSSKYSGMIIDGAGIGSFDTLEGAKNKCIDRLKILKSDFLNPMRRLKSLDKRVLPAAHSSEDQSCALTEQNETGLHGLVTS